MEYFQHNPQRNGLLIVDLQWDFCPGGRLPVPDAHQIVPVINEWIENALHRQIPVYASRDWHPRGHISFEEKGGPYAPHCLQDTDGAQFHPNLLHDDRILVVTKGTRFDKDQNSVFEDTGFAKRLEEDGVQRLLVGGLALEFCVRATVMDALGAGFEVCVIKDAVRPVDADSGRRALEQMVKAGAAVL